MRTKITLLLILLNAVLFLLIFRVDRQLRQDEELAAARRQIFGPEMSAADRIEITGGSAAPEVVLERHGESWFLSKPFDWPANPNAVDRLLNELRFIEPERRFPVAELDQTGSSLAGYGLEQPRMRVTLHCGDRSAGIAIGNDTPVAGRLYILSPDASQVLVVGRSLGESLSLPLEALRDPAVLTIPPFEVRSLTLQAADPAAARVRISHSGQRWMFETPVTTRADRARVELLLNKLNGLRVEQVLDAAEAESVRGSLATPLLKLTVEGTARRETLLVGATAANASGETLTFLQVEGRDTVVTVRSDAFEGLADAQTTLRDRRILDFNPADVSSVTLSAPGWPETTLQRLETGRWEVTGRPEGAAPRTMPGDPEIISNLLETLRYLESEAFVTDAPTALEMENYGFTLPDRTITLSFNAPPGAAAPPPVTLLLGVTRQHDGATYAKTASQPFVSRVRGGLVEGLPVVPHRYRNRTVQELPSGARITAVRMRSIGSDAIVLEAVGGEGAWIFTTPSGATPAQEAALGTLVACLRNLRARQFEADSFTADAPTWRYILDATIELEGGAVDDRQILSLHLSERLGGGIQLAGSARFDTVFTTTQEFLDAFDALITPPVEAGAPATPPAAAPPPALQPQP